MVGIEIRGVVASGFGQGKEFLSMPHYIEKINAAVGFMPFPGTLNLKVTGGELRRAISDVRAIEIGSFEAEGKEFGALKLYKCVIGDVDCAMIVPQKSRHAADIIEIIAAVNLREKQTLIDGKEVIVSDFRGRINGT